MSLLYGLNFVIFYDFVEDYTTYVQKTEGPGLVYYIMGLNIKQRERKHLFKSVQIKQNQTRNKK